MPEFLPIGDLLPHEGEMILLSEVIEHSEDITVCRAVVRADGLFASADGSTGSWLGVEMMAQCIATHSGLVGRREGRPPRIGLLVSCRRLDFATSRYDVGQVLRIRSEHVWGESTGMVSFACSIQDEESEQLLAEGNLNCFLPKDDAEFEQILAAGAGT